MKFLTPILILLSVVFALPASASNVLHCHYCTDHMMKSKAISTIPDGGKVHVVDLIDNKIRAYQVFRENDMVIVQSNPVSSTISNAVDEFKTTINLFDDIAHRGIDFNHLKPFLGGYSTVINSSYDIANKSRYRSAVARAISSYVGDTIAGELSTAVGALGLSFVNATASIHIAFQVKFPDGTTYKFHFKGIEYNVDGTSVMIVVPVKESGMDGDIIIPDNGDFNSYIQTAESMESLTELLEYMRQNGVEIVRSGSGGGRPVVVICDDFKHCTAMVK